MQLKNLGFLQVIGNEELTNIELDGILTNHLTPKKKYEQLQCFEDKNIEIIKPGYPLNLEYENQSNSIKLCYQTFRINNNPIFDEDEEHVNTFFNMLTTTEMILFDKKKKNEIYRNSILLNFVKNSQFKSLLKLEITTEYLTCMSEWCIYESNNNYDFPEKDIKPKIKLTCSMFSNIEALKKINSFVKIIGTEINEFTDALSKYQTLNENWKQVFHYYVKERKSDLSELDFKNAKLIKLVESIDNHNTSLFFELPKNNFIYILDKNAYIKKAENIFELNSDFILSTILFLFPLYGTTYQFKKIKHFLEDWYSKIVEKPKIKLEANNGNLEQIQKKIANAYIYKFREKDELIKNFDFLNNLDKNFFNEIDNLDNFEKYKNELLKIVKNSLTDFLNDKSPKFTDLINVIRSFYNSERSQLTFINLFGRPILAIISDDLSLYFFKLNVERKNDKKIYLKLAIKRICDMQFKILQFIKSTKNSIDFTWKIEGLDYFNTEILCNLKDIKRYYRIIFNITELDFFDMLHFSIKEIIEYKNKTGE